MQLLAKVHEESGTGCCKGEHGPQFTNRSYLNYSPTSQSSHLTHVSSSPHNFTVAKVKKVVEFHYVMSRNRQILTESTEFTY